MLEFLRKFQKIFFFVITFILIISFLFFGIFSTFPSTSQVEDQVVGKAVDGSQIRLSAMQHLQKILALDVHDERGSLLNDGVISKDFLETGLGALLASNYFEELKDDLQARFMQAKQYRPYAHPEAPFLSVQAVWDQFHPDLSRAFNALKSQLEVSPDTFTLLAQLYKEQRKMPPELVRRILFYQMNQYPSIQRDSSLQYQDFSLFGYRSAKDWFGEKWLEKVAGFIWNAALVAEEKGFFVSRDEIKADLLDHLQKANEQRSSSRSFYDELQHLGMTEKEVADAWQKVLLFRRYIHSIGDSVLVDHLFPRDVTEYSQEAVAIDEYRLPDVCFLKTAEDFFALQYYLDAVTLPEKDRLALPKAYRPIVEIEKNHPELVETVFTAEISQISKEQIALKVPLKNIFEWAFDHWDLLSKQFSFLKAAEFTREAQVTAFEQLTPSTRSQVDSWVRLRIVEERPEWIEEAFATSSPTEQTFSFSDGRVNVSFVKDPSSFKRLLESALEGKEEAIKELLFYSDGSSILYRVNQVKKVADKRVRTLVSLKQNGTLRQVLHRHLEKQYPKVREKHRADFIDKSGNWKPFSEVKEQLGWALYEDICKAIEGKEKGEKSTHDLHIRKRFAHAANIALKQLQEGASELEVIDQLQLVRQEKIVRRSMNIDSITDQAFMLEPHQWSSIHVSEKGQISFFYMKEKQIASDAPVDLLGVSKEMLAKEAMHMLAKRLIHRMSSNF